MGRRGPPPTQSPPRAGSRDGSDNGTYFVALQAGQVTDTGGTPVPADVLSTFSVAVLVVANTDDSGAGSLRAHLAAANANPGSDTILFDPAAFASPRTISLQTALPQITDSVVITGPGAGLLTVRRDPGAATNFRVFDSTAPALTIAGMTVTGGNPAGDGGGLLSMGTGPAVTLDRVVFSGNAATGEGGAVFINTGGLLTVRNSTLSGNSATTDGGGIYFFSGGSLLMENSTITGNTANGTIGGGGIYFFGTASATPPAGFTASTLVVRNSTISGNTSAAGGGARLSCRPSPALC